MSTNKYQTFVLNRLQDLMYIKADKSIEEILKDKPFNLLNISSKAYKRTYMISEKRLKALADFLGYTQKKEIKE